MDIGKPSSFSGRTWASTHEPAKRGERRALHVDVRSYEAADRIIGYAHYDANSAAATPSLNQGFGYDELGRPNSITTASASWSIGYDANGNRTSLYVMLLVLGALCVLGAALLAKAPAPAPAPAPIRDSQRTHANH
jgi:hypothetical protein